MPKEMLKTESSSPLYRQLITRLRDDIEGGVFPMGSKIPPEMTLCDTYGVSRVTVRKALAELTQDGLLIRRRGKGTFVSMPRICRNLKDVNSFHQSCRMMGREPSVRVMKVQRVVPEDNIALALGLEEDEQAIETVRLCEADGMPVSLEINDFPPRYSFLLEEDLTGSLYAALKSHGIEPDQATHDITLCYASPQQAKYLGLESGSALLSLHEVIYDQNGGVIHVSQQYIRGDRFTFRI
ncbi:MAG: GntR family transcriptional regulator [Clostridia bacterium]|nr:GntR family transcriptional regulator [Clostridia bacterium]